MSSETPSSQLQRHSRSEGVEPSGSCEPTPHSVTAASAVRRPLPSAGSQTSRLSLGRTARSFVVGNVRVSVQWLVGESNPRCSCEPLPTQFQRPAKPARMATHAKAMTAAYMGTSKNSTTVSLLVFWARQRPPYGRKALASRFALTKSLRSSCGGC